MATARRTARVAATIGIVALLLYLALLAFLFAIQSRLIFPGWWRGVHAAVADRRLHEIAVTTEDGLAGRLLFAAPQGDRPVILFFHGNGDSAASGAVAIAPYLDTGFGAVVPEYRGYNGLPGAPSEQGLYRDARAARRWMAAHGMGAGQTIVMGYSLGTGVAAQSALEQRPAALVLLAPFASMAAAARMRFPWLPAGLLVTQRFATIDKLGRIACPVLLVHGDRDATVPPANLRLLAAVRPDARAVMLPGVGHEIAWTPAAQRIVLTWMSALAASQPATPPASHAQTGER